MLCYAGGGTARPFAGAARRAEHLCVAVQAVLRELRAESKILPQIFHSFQDDACLYSITKTRACGSLLAMRDEGGSMASLALTTASGRAFAVGCIALALDELHHLGLICRSFSEPSAVVDARGYVVLLNFQYARRLGRGEAAYTLSGEPDFMAPEMVRGSGHTHAADWWALGVFVHLLATGTSPWHYGLRKGEANEMLLYDS